MNRAVIDLGTNTCLLLVASGGYHESEPIQILVDQMNIVRLGRGVDFHREFQIEEMESTLDCLKQYVEKIKQFKLSPNHVFCVATSQARDAKNSSFFFERVRKETGFIFHILSGKEESELTFFGALPFEESYQEMQDLQLGTNKFSTVVVDIGGGSTEIVSLDESVSIDMGAVRFTERYFKSDPVWDEEFWVCLEKIDQLLEQVKMNLENKTLIAVAGTATTLACWHLDLKSFDFTQVSSAVLHRGDIHRMVEELKWRSVIERERLLPYDISRSSVLLAGALILWRIMEKFDFLKCRVSPYGLRYGVLKRWLKPPS